MMPRMTATLVRHKTRCSRRPPPADMSSSMTKKIDLPQEPWIVMMGGGYFFTPSISALSRALAE
jgi:hypothetical protein